MRMFVNGEADAPQLPQYQCHKVVRAARIASVDAFIKANGEPTGAAILSFCGVERHQNNREASAEYLSKHQPQVGGYYVVYEDGYESFSPAEVFESGYTLVDEAKP